MCQVHKGQSLEAAKQAGQCHQQSSSLARQQLTAASVVVVAADSACGTANGHPGCAKCTKGQSLEAAKQAGQCYQQSSSLAHQQLTAASVVVVAAGSACGAAKRHPGCAMCTKWAIA
jgi:hypothetical protein